MQANNSPVCVERINEMTAGDPEFLQDIIEIYVVDSVSLVDSLRQTLERQDWAALQKEAHKLKGSSLNMGVPYVALIAQFLLEVARKGDARAAADHTIDELRKPDNAVAQWMGNVDHLASVVDSLGSSADPARQGLQALEGEFHRAREVFERMAKEAA